MSTSSSQPAKERPLNNLDPSLNTIMSMDKDCGKKFPDSPTNSGHQGTKHLTRNVVCKCCGLPINTGGRYVAATPWMEFEDGTKARRSTVFDPHAAPVHMVEHTCPTGTCKLCDEEQVCTSESSDLGRLHSWKWKCDATCPCHTTTGWPS